MKKYETIVGIIILLSFAIGIYFYPKIPDLMVSHWNIQGRADGYIQKFWGLFLMPFLSIFLYLLMSFFPEIDPLKNNVKKFRKYYNSFLVLIMLFLFYLDILMIAWNLGYTFSMVQFLLPAMGIVFYYSGVLMENSSMNWFIGIKTPWTLSSQEVWKKTNRLGGKLFKIVAIVTFLSIFLGSISFWIMIASLLGIVIYVYVYSYLEYKKGKK